MKVEINERGYFLITAETREEALAIEELVPVTTGQICDVCHQRKISVIFDCGVLVNGEGEI